MQPIMYREAVFHFLSTASQKRPFIRQEDAFDGLFARYKERTVLSQYLHGLPPGEHNGTLVTLATIVPGAYRHARRTLCTTRHGMTSRSTDTAWSVGKPTCI